MKSSNVPVAFALRAGSALGALAFATVIGSPAFAQDATNTQPTPASPATQSSSPDETNGGPNPGTETPTGATKNANAGSANTEIVVTGTLLRRTNTETPSPVTVLTAETLNDRGINTVSQAVTTISANNAGTVPQGWNNGSNFATGATGVSLRGLTVQDTLVLFDGQRQAFYPLSDDGRRNFVDLNTIPDAVVDRVEVLRDGASSTYGSDAIAGVVNVITKKEIRGVHLNASHGFSQHGGGAENRVDATVGFGDLANDGVNFYVNGEYQSTDAIWARQRDYPFNSSNLSGICTSPDNCGFNGDLNGISADGSFNGLFGVVSPAYAPYNGSTLTLTDPLGVEHTVLPGGARLGEYTSLGCVGRDRPVTLNADQQGSASPWRPVYDEDGNIVSYRFSGTAYTGPNYGANQCELDPIADFQQNQPEQKRYGIFAHSTFRVGDRAEAFVSGNFYEVKTSTISLPQDYRDRTAAGDARVSYNPFLLPVYVCPLGTPYINDSTAARNNTVFNCTADTPGARLNPLNPLAGEGQQVAVVGRYDRPHMIDSDARSYRFSAGINGDFGAVESPFRYNVNASASRIDLTITQQNYLNPRHAIIAANTGTFDFLHPENNTQEQRDFVFPTSVNDSYSSLIEMDGTLSKEFFALPGGNLGAAVGLQYRKEVLNNPSANPANPADPYDRYATINSVGAVGKRNVKSAYFEVDAPIFSLRDNGFGLDANLSGRYDSYSSGQKNFSPKLGVKFTPVRQLALRGTFSKGFRVPSFNEAFGLPTTGYVTQQVDCTEFADFCAAHGGNAYAIQPYSFGLTAVGNPDLKPEKSRSITLGAIFEPIPKLSFTADYWDIKIDNLIGDNPNTDIALQQYYANNGVVNVPGITVIPGVPDVANPNALPLIGEIQYGFVNANSLRARGIDLGAIGRFNLGSVKWTSSLEASLLLKYQKQNEDGSTEDYAGTLSPCNTTSCSGSPRWRATWQNTFDFGRLKATLTSYYTSGYDLASVDAPYAGVKGDCEASIGQSVVTGTGGEPLLCRGPRTFYHDVTAAFDLTDTVTLYGAVLNVFDQKPKFDPSAAYGIYNYNVAWQQAMFVGRFFRFGAKFDLNPPAHVEPVDNFVMPPPPPPAAPATQTCPDGSVILATAACPAPPPPPPPAPVERGERGL